MKNIAVYAIEKNNHIQGCVCKFVGINSGVMFLSTTNQINEEEYEAMKNFVRSFGGTTCLYATKIEKLLEFVDSLVPSNFIMHKRSAIFEQIVTDKGHKFETI